MAARSRWGNASTHSGPAHAAPPGPDRLRFTTSTEYRRKLPEHRAFLRWLAADSESELAAAAERVLSDHATDWQDCGTWTTDGPAVLMDATIAGTGLGTAYPPHGLPDQAPVPLPAGTWKVRAVHTKAGELTWFGLVCLLPITQALSSRRPRRA